MVMSHPDTGPVLHEATPHWDDGGVLGDEEGTDEDDGRVGGSEVEEEPGGTETEEDVGGLGPPSRLQLALHPSPL